MEGKIVYQGKTKKGNDIVVRYPNATDAKQMHRYINALSKEQTFILFQGKEISLESEEKYVADTLSQIEEHKKVVLLVFAADTLIGMSDIILSSKEADKHTGVFGITIAKEYRGEGIGKILMQLVFEEAQRNLPELLIVILGVFGNNLIAKNMYERFGFVEYGMLPKGLLHKGEYVDHYYMYKNIR